MNHTIYFNNASEARDIGVLLDPLLSEMESELNLEIVLRDLFVGIEGDDERCAKAIEFIEGLRAARERTGFDEQAAAYAFDAMTRGEEHVFNKLASIRIDVSPANRPFSRKRSDSRFTFIPCGPIPSPSALDPPAPEKPIWPWPWRSHRC